MKGKSGSMKPGESSGSKGKSPRLAARPLGAAASTKSPAAGVTAKRNSGVSPSVSMATKRHSGVSPKTSVPSLVMKIKRTRTTAEKDYAKMAEGEPIPAPGDSSSGKSSTPKPASMRTRLSTGSISMNGTTTISIAKEKAELDSIVKQINKSENLSGSKSGSLQKKRSSQSGPIESSEHPPPKKRKIGRNDGSGEDNRNDYFCWLCHKEGSLICCELCPRVFHARCLGLGTDLPADWVCPECERIMRSECVDTRSKSMEMLTLDQFSTLLEYALDRMKHEGSEPFQQPVDVSKVPNYSDYIFNPMDLSILEKNIKDKVYGCTEAFLADVKWIQHNCILYNGTHSKLTSSAKMIVKICKHEMNEIELCPDCYLNSCIRENDDWFSEPCRVPHTLVWAKLKGYPFWPSKALRELNGEVDVRFFGAHDRSWVPVSQCFLLSKNIPTSLQKGKKNAGLDGAIDELNIHINKLRVRFGHFEYAPFRTPYDKTDAYKPINLKPSNSKPLKSPTAVSQKMSMTSKTASGIKSKYNAMMNTKKLEASPDKHRKDRVVIKDEVVSGDEQSDFDMEVSDRKAKVLIDRLPSPKMEELMNANELNTDVDDKPKLSETGHVVVEEKHVEENPIKKSFVSRDILDKIAKKLEDNAKGESVSDTDVEVKSSEGSSDVHQKDTKADKPEVSDVNNDKDNDDKAAECKDTSMEDKTESVKGVSEDKVIDETKPSDTSPSQITDSKDDAEVVQSNKDDDIENVTVQSSESSAEFRKKLETTISACKAKLGMAGDGKNGTEDEGTEDELEEDSEGVLDSTNASEASESSNEEEYETYESSDASGNKVSEADVTNETVSEECKDMMKSDTKGGSDKKAEDMAVDTDVVNQSTDDVCSDTTAENTSNNQESKTQEKETCENVLSNDKVENENSGPSSQSLDNEKSKCNVEDVTDNNVESAASQASKSDIENTEKCMNDDKDVTEADSKASGSVEETELGKSVSDDTEEVNKDKEKPESNITEDVKILEKQNNGTKDSNTESKKQTSDASENGDDKIQKDVQDTKSPGKKQKLDASTGEMMEVDLGGESDSDSDALVIDMETEVSNKSRNAGDVVTSHSNKIASDKDTVGESEVPSGIADVRPDTAIGSQDACDKETSPVTEIDGVKDASGATGGHSETNNSNTSLFQQVQQSTSTTKPNKTADSIAEKFSKKLLATLQEALHEMYDEVQTDQSKNSGVAEMNRLLAQAKWDYTSELNEIKQNFNLTISEMKGCWLAERDQLQKSLNQKHSDELTKKIKEIKKKQWCAYCEKEAIFYCCWNTSYCDYPCQQNHWPTHMHTCLQTNKNGDKSGTKATPDIVPTSLAAAEVPTTSAPPSVSNVAMATTSAVTSTPVVSQNVTNMYRHQLSESFSAAMHRNEDRPIDVRGSHISPKYIPMSSPLQHVRQGSPASMATNLIFSNMSQQAHMVRAGQTAVMTQMPPQPTNQFVNAAQMAGKRQTIQTLQPGMVLPQPVVRHALYPVQARPLGQPMPGTILFQNQQQGMMGFGVRPPF